VKREAPFVIPAGKTERLECTVEPIRPGSFENQLHVFVDDRGTREIVVMVRGTARGPGAGQPPKREAAAGDAAAE
jgi:hypothetical protein